MSWTCQSCMIDVEIYVNYRKRDRERLTSTKKLQNGETWTQTWRQKIHESCYHWSVLSNLLFFFPSWIVNLTSYTLKKYSKSLSPPLLSSFSCSTTSLNYKRQPQTMGPKPFKKSLCLRYQTFDPCCSQQGIGIGPLLLLVLYVQPRHPLGSNLQRKHSYCVSYAINEISSISSKLVSVNLVS